MDTKVRTNYYVVTKKNHRHIPYKKRVSEADAQKAAKTGKYTYEIWPDNDSFHTSQEVEVEVYQETTTISKVTKKL